jgi:hypothetical protein
MDAKWVLTVLVDQKSQNNFQFESCPQKILKVELKVETKTDPTTFVSLFPKFLLRK